MVFASPMRSFVTIIVFAPALSASIAADAPAPPPPMISTSTSYVTSSRFTSAALILLCAYGITLAVDRWKKLLPVIGIAYGLSAVLFFGTYFTGYAEESRQYYNRDFLDAVAEADSMEEYEKLYITGNLGWQFNQAATEILTQYVCKTDAQYYQEKTNISNGRELPAYSERYHYIYPEKMGNELAETARDGLLVLYRGDLQYLDFSYEVVDTVGEYFLITVQK